uniref:Putative secreted peptide n=1 Tax=Anopheles braziliensis TaxID=58242 RepID=A0A2M3ZSS1_9DIPT
MGSVAVVSLCMLFPVERNAWNIFKHSPSKSKSNRRSTCSILISTSTSVSLCSRDRRTVSHFECTFWVSARVIVKLKNVSVPVDLPDSLESPVCTAMASASLRHQLCSFGVPLHS